MRVVVDANILFALLIRGDFTLELFLREDVESYAPEFLLEEFESYQHYLLDKTSRREEDFLLLMELFKRRIQLIPLSGYSSKLDEARAIISDEKDTAYVALALTLNCPIWSNDKRLKRGQTKIGIYSTSEWATFLHDLEKQL